MGMGKTRVGLYGFNGHQIHQALVGHPAAEVVAVAGAAGGAVPVEARGAGVRVFDTLDQMLAGSDAELISVCSPRRADQADESVRCMDAGRHVYAEKPSALTEEGLDRVAAAARRNGVVYHEQIPTAFVQPYATLRDIAASGVLGQIVQVFGQKSYPWHDRREQDEQADGGLTTQVGVYLTRFVEHVAGVKIKSITAKETTAGNPVAGGGCRRAASVLMELENGGLATGVANYLGPQPPSWQNWGYETVRVWGVDGFVESIDLGRIGTLKLNGRPPQPLDFSRPVTDLLERVVGEVRTGEKTIPFTLEEELSPTRWIVRAKRQLDAERK